MSTGAIDEVEELRKGFASQVKKELTGHKRKITAIAWNCTGRRLCSVSLDGTGRTWTTDSSGAVAKEHELKAHADTVDSLCWDPQNGDVLATASSDKTLCIWDCRTPGKAAATVQDVGETLNAAWQSDGTAVALSDRSDTLRIVEARAWRVVKAQRCDFMIHDMAWHPRSPLLFLATDKGTVNVAQASTLAITRRCRASMSALYALRFDPSGAMFAVGCADDTYSVWDSHEFFCTKALSGFQSAVRTLSFNHDSSLIAAGSGDEFLDVTHIGSGLVVHRETTDGPAWCCAFNPKLPMLAWSADSKENSIGIISVPVPKK